MTQQPATVGHAGALGPGGAPRLVVGVDGSAASLEALRWAGRMAPLLGARIEAVTVPDRASSYYGYSVEAEIVSPHDDAIRGLAGSVAAVFGDTPPVPVAERVVTGHGAADTLVDVARGATLLVVGAHGGGNLAGRLLGSVATACAEQAPCPVVVVPAPRR